MALGKVRERLCGWQVSRVRDAYTSVSGHRSSLPGFDGMIDEMRWGLDHLSPQELALADERVLETVFFGARSLRLFQRASRRWSKPAARLLARASPVGLGFLVGELRWAPPDENDIPRCRFREQGGERMCREVCQRPAMAFCAERLLPVHIEPVPDSLACRWRWDAGEQGTP